MNKILMGPVIAKYGSCGVSDHIRSLGEYLKLNYKIDIVFYTHGFPEASIGNAVKFNNIPIINFPEFTFGNFFKIKQLFIEINPCFINFHFPSNTISSNYRWTSFVAFFSFFLKKRILITLHGYFLERWNRSLSIRFLLFSKKIEYIVLSKLFLSRVDKIHKASVSNRTLHFVQPFEIISDCAHFSRESYNLNEIGEVNGRELIIFFGHVSRTKRLDLLLVHIDFSQFKLVFVSDFNLNEQIDGTDNALYAKLLKEEVKNNNVTLLNNISDCHLLYLLKNSSLIFLPLNEEPISMNSSFLLSLLTSTPILTFTDRDTFFDTKRQIQFINYSDFSNLNYKILNLIKCRSRSAYTPRIGVAAQQFLLAFKLDKYLK